MTKGVFIDGRWQAGTGSALTSLDPATGQVVWQEASAGPDQVAAAVAAAHRAFQAWSDTPRDDRIALMRRYKAVLEARTPQMAKALSQETGKALWETTAELGSMIGKIEVSIAAFNERTGEKRSDMPFGQAVLRHRGHGVMAILGPFNFPGHLPNGHIVPALLAGDCVVFKPSEETPLAGQALVEALIEAPIIDGALGGPVLRELRLLGRLAAEGQPRERAAVRRYRSPVADPANPTAADLTYAAESVELVLPCDAAGNALGISGGLDFSMRGLDDPRLPGFAPGAPRPPRPSATR